MIRVPLTSYLLLIPLSAPGIQAMVAPDNERYFSIRMWGPAGTPYEKGLYNLEVFLPAKLEEMVFENQESDTQWNRRNAGL